MNDRDEIRSYGVIFTLERRLHRIDQFRIPLPYGLPLRSAGYAAALLALVLVAGRAPVLGAMVSALPSPFRLAVIPGIGSHLLTRLRIDGRPAGAVVVAASGYRLRPRRVRGWRRCRRDRTARLADFVLTRSDCRSEPVDAPAGERLAIR